MDEDVLRFVRVVVVGGAIGLVLGGVLALAVEFLRPRRACPRCGSILPRLRRPASWRQLFLGGWTCRACGCEVDYHGRERPIRSPG